MTIYFLYLAVVILVGWYLLGDTITPRNRAICLGVTAVAVLVIMTCRYSIGYDYISYERIFTEVSAMSMGEVIATHRMEPVFFIFTKLMSMVSLNYHVFLLACNLIMVGFVFWTIYRYSPMWWVSAVLYLTLQFMPHSMNLLRQSIAASIIFASFPFLKKGKLIPYMLMVLLASSFHISAIIMIPAYFLLRAPYKLSVLATYSGIVLVAYIGFTPILRFATTYLFPQYAQYVNSSIYAGQNSFAYVMMPFAYVLGVLLAAKGLLERDKQNNALIYSSVFTFFVYLFITRMYIVERFSIYFFMFAMILLPEIIVMLTPKALPTSPTVAQKVEYKKQNENQKVVMILVVFGSIAYMLFAATTGFHKAYPYVSIFDKQNAVSNDSYFQDHTN
ncbi:MAG: EpsG family protein [Angelakisella sp.]